MKKRTKFFDFIYFVLGPPIVIIFLLSFSSTSLDGHYYFSDSTAIGVAIGVAFICLGFLRVYWRKNTSPKREVEGEKKKPKDKPEKEKAREATSEILSKKPEEDKKKDSKKRTVTFY